MCFSDHNDTCSWGQSGRPARGGSRDRKKVKTANFLWLPSPFCTRRPALLDFNGPRGVCFFSYLFLNPSVHSVRGRARGKIIVSEFSIIYGVLAGTGVERRKWSEQERRTTYEYTTHNTYTHTHTQKTDRE